MKLSVIIPNYNGRSLLARNLPRVLKETPGNEIIVVDDASTDDSVSFLQKNFPQVKVFKKGKNEGFSSTVNLGVKKAKGDLVFLLNSDAYPEKGSLEIAVKHFENPEVFAVGLTLKCSEDGKEMIRGRGVGRFKKGFLFHNAGDPAKTTTLWVSGGAGIFRKKIWEKLGGLNELYNPFYWEDIDLSYRAAKAGFKLVFEPKSIVIHAQSEGSIRSKYSPGFIKTIAYRNQILFVWLNISSLQLLVNHFIYLSYHLIRSVAVGDWEFIKGFIQAITKIPQVLSKRAQNKKHWNKPDDDLFITEI